MSYNWFNCLYFSPRNKCLPELIMQDGNRAPLRQISKIEMLMDITKESFVGKFKEPLIIYNGTHNIPNLDKLFISDKGRKFSWEDLFSIWWEVRSKGQIGPKVVDLRKLSVIPHFYYPLK